MAVAATALMTCHAQANRPAPVGAGAQTTPVPSDRFDPAVVVPSPEVTRVREALAEGAPETAERLARAALEEADPALRSRLRWLLARAALQRKKPGDALDHLRAVAEAEGPLAPWAGLRRAELLAEGHPERAARTAAPLAARDWAGKPRARLLEARAWAEAGEADEAIPKLRQLVAEAPDHVGAASPGMPLAELLAERADDPDALEEALALYRRVATRAPRTRVGREAGERADELLKKLPRPRRTELAELTPEDALARAHALYGSMRHEEAEEAFEALARRWADDPSRRCEAQLYQGKALLRQREREAGAELLARVADACSDTDVRARARFLTARAHAQRGENTEAIEHYAIVEKEAPDHRLADDALFRAALAAEDEGDTEDMVRRLAALPKEYPHGDMRPEARFRLAWHARDEERWDEALKHLEALIHEGADEWTEGQVGRAAYWRARSLADAGKAGEAADAYVSLVRTWPLSYHGQQALERLAEIDPARAKAARARLRATGEGEGGLTFPHRPELEDPAFVRALELLRVGDTDLATRELEHLGALGAGADKGMLWLVAAVLDRAGAHPEASRLVRTRLGSFRRTLPVGQARSLWRLAYPRAFSPLIENVAKKMDVPASYVRAVAREESAFDPDAVSVARARGLIQLMEPTARRFARDLDLELKPGSLHDPKTNVRVGSRFIRYLFERYRHNPAVVPAAYNAGEGAAARWIRARPDLPLDRWIEEIPYDETRRYTRRVLETWGTYRFLDKGEIPTLAAELPEPT